MVTLSSLITKSEDVKDLIAVSGTGLLFGGLNIIYGMDGTGKSWQTVGLLSESGVNNYYIDTDGSNGKKFVEHCEVNSVGYISNDTVISYPKESTNIGAIEAIVKQIGREHTDGVVVVIDSLTSMLDGVAINNAEDISPWLYRFNNLGSKYNVCIVLIDHATQKDDGFKLEGNAGAKRRTTVSVHRYEPTDLNKPEAGGVFKCERARGNSGSIKRGTIILVSTNDLTKAIGFVVSKFPNIGTEAITKTAFTKATKHQKDLWVRLYQNEMFDEYIDGRTTMLKGK